MRESHKPLRCVAGGLKQVLWHHRIEEQAGEVGAEKARACAPEHLRESVGGSCGLNVFSECHTSLCWQRGRRRACVAFYYFLLFARQRLRLTVTVSGNKGKNIE